MTSPAGLLADSFAKLLFEADVCVFVNGIPQLRRVVFDGLNDAAKNRRKVNLR
jgi:hypothetical protein